VEIPQAAVVVEVAEETPRPSKPLRRTTKAPTTQVAPPQRPLVQLEQFANIPPSSPVHPISKSLPNPQARQQPRPEPVKQQPLPLTLPTITTRAPSPRKEVQKEKEEVEVEESGVIDELVNRSLSEEERGMTLEQLIRHEYKRRYEAMKAEGEEMIKKWEERAGESRKLLEAL
jgi:hypothetical protein